MNEEKWTIFGDRLMNQLEKQNISYRKFADGVGLTLTTVSRYANSQRIPRATEIVKAANYLGVTCDYMLGLSNDPHTKLQWTPVREKLPKINQRVLLVSSGGLVFVGNRCKPELIWQVTEEDGRKHWVYDPEAYTDDIDSLPKGEDCAFEQDTRYAEDMLSVSSANYTPRFEGVIAWMPLPEPYKG